MRILKEEKIMTVDSIYCDKCESEIISESESLSINHTFGYFSKDLDGTKIKLDICEECLPKILGEVLMEIGKRN